VSNDDPDAWLRELLALGRVDGQHVLAVAQAARAARAPRRRPEVEYRCQANARCLLGQVFVIPSVGSILYHPSYRYSPGATHRQRAARREFGERAYRLEPMACDNRTSTVLAADPSAASSTATAVRVVVQFQCDHLVTVLDPADVLADLKAGRRRRVLDGPGA